MLLTLHLQHLGFGRIRDFATSSRPNYSVVIFLQFLRSKCLQEVPVLTSLSAEMVHTGWNPWERDGSLWVSTDARILYVAPIHTFDIPLTPSLLSSNT
jgi:hypothetical protein